MYGIRSLLKEKDQLLTGLVKDSHGVTAIEYALIAHRSQQHLQQHRQLFVAAAPKPAPVRLTEGEIVR